MKEGIVVQRKSRRWELKLHCERRAAEKFSMREWRCSDSTIDTIHLVEL